MAAILLATMIGVPAMSGFSDSPSGFKPLKGTVKSSNPIVEMSANDDKFLVIESQRVRTGDPNRTQAVIYQVSHSAFPGLGGNIQVLYRGKTENGSETCHLRISLWHWKKRRFVDTGAGLIVTSAEGETQTDPQDTARYLRDGRIRAKIACYFTAAFDLETDQIRFF